MSRIESGKAESENKPFDIGKLLENCKAVIAGQVAEKNLQLTERFEILHLFLLGGALHLRQILINILGNAVKFTPEGGSVLFSATERELDRENIELTAVISDTGIGMSPEFLERLFEPFHQEHAQGRVQYLGTGLGMSIVKELLTIMGGEIDVQSEQGGGSTFTERLRYAVAEMADIAPANVRHQNVLQGLRVLMVGDNELNAEIARYILEEHGAQVTAADNGKEGVERYLDSPEGRFDGILIAVLVQISRAHG